MSHFDVPVCLIIFKRSDKAAAIVDQISRIKPAKLYLIGDGPRNKEEKADVLMCRKTVESHITWDCEVVKYYSEKNRGVYENIAGGAKWVFQRESFAIFLEDDNYPAISFFQFCREMLLKYKEDNRIMWVCGTNYLKEYKPIDGSDYVFTQLMLPCGWASWSHKFTKFYDGNLDLFRVPYLLDYVKGKYNNKTLLRQNIRSWNLENSRIMAGLKPISWDFQMAYSLRVHNLLGIAPKYNLIRNIGADNFSMHGHDSMNNEMTKRFCELETRDLIFPLNHPKLCFVDLNFEKLTELIIIQPFMVRLKSAIGPSIKKFLNIPSNISVTKKKSSVNNRKTTIK
nr:glycosyltransferase family 2 protein [uncultured Bacteroides sp.]